MSDPAVDKVQSGTATQIENAAIADRAAPKRRGGIVGHFRRFWWVHLIVVVVLVAVLVPILILVIVPKIVQQKMDSAQLTLISISAMNTTSDSYSMNIKSILEADASIHATIESFDGVMYLEDWAPQRPFATLKFPEVTTQASQMVEVSSVQAITDLEAFTVFNTWLLLNTTLRVTVKGDTNVHVKGISKAYPAHFQKTLSMDGLQLFAGTTVEDARISLVKDKNGNNFNGTAVIPNRSVVTFEIGNATFTNYLNGSDIGEVFIDNMTLRPGINKLPMRATVAQAPVLTAIVKRPSCESGVIDFGLGGKNVVNNGQRLAYFSDSLAAANQTVGINIKQALKDSLNMTIACSTTAKKMI